VQRLTGDFITSSEIGHLKKLGTVIYKSSLTMFGGGRKLSENPKGSERKFYRGREGTDREGKGKWQKTRKKGWV
jgi:hypothetical protein